MTPTATARRDARASGLRYVSPGGPGITRRRAGRGFTYRDAHGSPVTAEQELARIRRIAIPPAWTDVWICPSEDGHIQAIGRDARGRLQYRYHAGFRARRDTGKFARLVEVGARLPRIRARVRSDLARAGLPREKVLAAVIRLLDATGLRVGNDAYARVNRSFGASTLRNRHAQVQGATLRFRFRGKGGRVEERSLVDRSLAAIVRRCQELPGQELFQYAGDDGEPRAISSEDVNEYLREAAGTDAISAKDLRTWAGTMHAFRALREGAAQEAEAEARNEAGRTRRGQGATPAVGPPRKHRNLVNEAIRRAAEELGDTIAVTRNSYVHPGVIAAFEPGAATEPPAAPRVPARATPGRANRRDELDLLRVLRTVEGVASKRRAAAARSTGSSVAATTSKVGRAGGAGRPRGRAA